VPSADPDDVVAVVEEQVNAYNARDLERFLAAYAPTVVIVNGSDAVLCDGREAMRPVYGPLFAGHSVLRSDISARLHLGQWVVDEEHVTGVSIVGLRLDVRAIAIYRVAERKIQHVRLLQ
jgi:hypothetical protein